MSLCINSTTLTFDGVRADDGGVPEELSVTISKYCIDPSPEFVPNAYDSRYDSEFTFSPEFDGSYHVIYTGSVSGIIEEEDVLVRYHADNEVGRIAKMNIGSLMCNKCVDHLYMYKKALIAMAEKMFACERLCEAEQFLLDVVSEDCTNKIKDCGCS